MNLEYKAFGGLQIETPTDSGRIKALVSVFSNVDRGGERVMPGAFTKSIERQLPYFVLGHDWKQVLGVTVAAVETEKGLEVEGQFNLETQVGRETYSNIKMNALREFSIGYQVIQDSIEEKSGVRELHEVLLHEWSPVLVGMNPATSLLSIKSDVPATLANQADDVLAYIVELAARTKSLADLRAKEGRVISTANRNRISACAGSMRSVADELDALLSMSEPMPKADAADVRQVYAEIINSGYLTESVKKWN